MDPYANRNGYRSRTGGGDLILTRVTAEETDLAVYAWKDVKRAADAAAVSVRKQIQAEIRRRPEFYTSLIPLEPRGDETDPVRRMLSAAKTAGTGPMAAVAGLIAELTGRELLSLSDEVIVENGGDIFLAGKRERTVALFAGTSPLTGKIGIRIVPGSGYGVCTSSGTYGHSLSFGKADAAVVLAQDAALSDAAATMLGNRCTEPAAMKDAVDWAVSLQGVDGAIAVIGDRIAFAGAFLADRIVALEDGK